MDEFTCAITGRTPKTEELVEDAPDDDLENLPLGWLKVTVQQRAINPIWEKVQAVKRRRIEASKADVQMRYEGAGGDDPELLALIQADAEVLVEMDFLAADKEIPKYVIDEDEVYIRDPSKDKDVEKEWARIADTLAIEIGASRE